MVPLALVLTLTLTLVVGAAAAAKETGLHPEWPRRCGKAYRDEFPDFYPGGQVTEPAINGPHAKGLHMRLQTRYSMYLASETRAEFVVSAEISSWFGQRWPGLGTPPLEAPPVRFSIHLTANRDVVLASGEPPADSAELFAFNISRLAPRLHPYSVMLAAAAQPGAPNVTVRGDVVYLPEKQGGSVARLDRLGGGILFRGPATGGRFEPFLPYGFYAECDGLCGIDSGSLMDVYRGLGVNSMVPLMSVDKAPEAFDGMDRLDVRFMYDVRHARRNLSELRRHVDAVKDRPALYAYWVAHEPDGDQEPFEVVGDARAAIRAADPYHPVAVALFCQDYYYGRYSADADIVFENVYPVAANSSYSWRWGTPCNATYGDCGCDNCRGDVGDVARRFDDRTHAERWLGRWPKTKAHASQSFAAGAGHWERTPRPDDVVAMAALALNHGAKAVAAWGSPMPDALADAHSRFARAVVRSPAGALIAGGRARRARVRGRRSVDAAYWASPTQLLVSAVNTREQPVDGALAIPVPASALPAGEGSVVLWGGGSWRVANGTLLLDGMAAMSTHMVLLGGGSKAARGP